MVFQMILQIRRKVNKRTKVKIKKVQMVGFVGKGIRLQKLVAGIYSSKNDNMYKQCILCLLVVILLPAVKGQGTNLTAGCSKSNYTSTFTKCDITFLNCFSATILQKCHMRKCERFIRGNDCALWIQFVLDNSTCFKDCCGASTFDEQACNAYNQSKAARESSIQTGFIVAMVIVAVALLAIVGWFSYKHLGCCDKSQKFKLMKYNVHWRRQEFCQMKCLVCHTYGSVLVTPCDHYYHVSCFQEATKEMVCPKCKEPIKDRVKIYCFSCREYCFKVKLWKVSELSEAISEAKGLHYDLCPKEVKTQRKLAESEEGF